jgi:RecA-family ATPase
MHANENDRAKVRQFISSLTRLAPAVLLLAHVDAASSMADPREAKGYSGSTGWNNSVRSRWFMSKAKDGDDIILTLPKVNYAKAGSEAVIRWSESNGVFEVVSTREGRVKAADNRQALLGMLHHAIDMDKRIVSPAVNTRSSVFNTLKDMEGFPAGLKSQEVSKEVSRWKHEGLVIDEHYTALNRKVALRLILTKKGLALLSDGGGADNLA